MRRVLSLICFLLGIGPAAAEPSITGLWLTQGGNGVIAIAPCDGGVCGRIVGFFLDRPTDSTPRDYRGLSQCNLPLITDAKPIRPNLWKGHIVDPRNGHIFGVELHLTPNGTLALRGFLGFPVLGQTQIWTRYQGSAPRDCRIMPTTNANITDRQSGG